MGVAPPPPPPPQDASANTAQENNIERNLLVMELRRDSGG